MNNDSIRIEKIKSDHAELLKLVRNSIVENKEHLSESIDSVITILDFDDKCVKKQEAMEQARELIASLTEEILNAKTKEEVFEIRKKLNYYINKIKAEIKKRNVSEETLNDYYNKATYLRKDIAKYIRFLKREDNIAEIDRLYDRYESLNAEEMETLKKALRREMNYNHRNLNPPVEKKEEVVSEVREDVSEEPKEEVVSGDVEEPNPFDLSFIKKDVKKSDPKDQFAFLREELGLDEPKSDLERDRFVLSEEIKRSDAARPQYIMKDLQSTEYSEMKEYLDYKANQFAMQYRVEPTLDYSRRHRVRNFVHFFRNIPRYIYNKKVLKHMMADFCRFYNGGDFGSFIEYIKSRNSIRNGLKCLFSKSHLYSNENLIKHEKCSRWIYDFCKRNHLNISYQVEKTI